MSVKCFFHFFLHFLFSSHYHPFIIIFDTIQIKSSHVTLISFYRCKKTIIRICKGTHLFLIKNSLLRVQNDGINIQRVRTVQSFSPDRINSIFANGKSFFPISSLLESLRSHCEPERKITPESRKSSTGSWKTIKTQTHL